MKESTSRERMNVSCTCETVCGVCPCDVCCNAEIIFSGFFLQDGEVRLRTQQTIVSGNNHTGLSLLLVVAVVNVVVVVIVVAVGDAEIFLLISFFLSLRHSTSLLSLPLSFRFHCLFCFSQPFTFLEAL